MKTVKTGDESGGLHRIDGSSTPPRTGGSSNSNETAESTVDKNAPGAFTKEPGGTNDTGDGDDGRLRNGTDIGADGT